MSYKLIIADDEQIERDVLTLIVGRELPEVEIVAEAKNGRQAVELAEQWQPDVMMLDIKMPGMDGLTAIREIRESLPMTKFILVSAYDYFDYAKEAVTLGVKEYLLKPASKQEVVETLGRLLREIETERTHKREADELREQVAQLLPIVEKELTTLLIVNEEVESYESYARLLHLPNVTGFAIVATFHPKEEVDIILSSVNKQRWYEKLHQKAREWSHSLVSPLLWQQVTIFVLVQDGETKATNGYSSRMEAIKLARRLAHLFTHEPVRVLFGIGNVYNGFAGLRQSFQEAVLAVKDPSAPAPVHHYADLPFAATSYAYSLEQEKQLLEKVRLGRVDEGIALFHHMLDQVVQASQGNMRYLRRFLMECVTVVSRVAFEYQLPLTDFSQFSTDDLTTLAQVKQTGEHWIRKITTMIHDERSRRTGNVLEQVKRHLTHHYHTDIKLEEVAEQFHISPYYLSKLFSQQCGITFIDYLTTLRIAEAKRLLTDTPKGLKEIAYEVGYANPNYFSRVFKKVTGQAPSDYRRE